MKKKLTLAIAAYVLMAAGILTYIYCPRTVIKNTAMWYEKDFTIPVFCKTVKFKQLYDIGLYDGQFEVSKDQAETIVKQLDDAVERFEMSRSLSRDELSNKELEIKENTTCVVKEEIAELNPEIKKKIVDEIWDLDDEIEVIGFYYSYPNEWECNCERG